MGKETLVASQQPDTNSAEKTDNLWNSILAEASRSVSDRLESRTLVLLGDRNCGKTTLIAKLQGIDVSETGKGIALDYSFLDIHTTAEEDEPVARLNLWQLEGEEEHKELLKFALNPSTIQNAMIAIVLDFSQPWNLVASLNRWLQIAENYVKGVIKQLPSGVAEELKNYQIYDFQQYTEPSAAPPAHGPAKIVKKKKQVDEQALLPLSDNVLSTNLGIPILVICTKTDTMLQLEKEYGYKDSHFDFIHQYIRKICLKYGAGLIYVSAKKDRNCDVLMQYLKHKLYGFEFHVKPMLEKDVLFFPSGFDSLKKISTDFANQNLTRDPEEAYEDVIKIPKILIQSENEVEPLIVSEDDQEFFAKHKESLDKDPASKGDKSAKTTPGLLNSLRKFGTLVNSTDPASPGAPEKPTPVAPSPTLSSTPMTAEPAAPAPKTNEHTVLAEFFTSLINKDRTTPVGPLPTTKPTTPPITTVKPQSPAPTISSPAPRSTTTTPASREDIAKQLERLRGKMNQ